MTNRELKKAAMKRIEKNSDSAAISTLFFFTAVVTAVLAELGLTIVFRMAGYRDYFVFSLDFYRQNRWAVMLLILRAAVYGVVFSVLKYLICRNFIGFDYEERDGRIHTKRFLTGHVRRLIVPSLVADISLLALKLIAVSPALVSSYLMVRFYRSGVHGELKLGFLFAFMLATGFTLVWLAVTVKYYVSLCLVPYIVELNPRANFFDACDLSVKLMEGRHMRVAAMMVSLLPLLLCGLLFYPLLVIYPYITECRLLLAKDIMGSYWQDKIPAMARRWEKQMKRLGR